MFETQLIYTVKVEIGLYCEPLIQNVTAGNIIKFNSQSEDPAVIK